MQSEHGRASTAEAYFFAELHTLIGQEHAEAWLLNTLQNKTSATQNMPRSGSVSSIVSSSSSVVSSSSMVGASGSAALASVGLHWLLKSQNQGSFSSRSGSGSSRRSSGSSSWSSRSSTGGSFKSAHDEHSSTIAPQARLDTVNSPLESSVTDDSDTHSQEGDVRVTPRAWSTRAVVRLSDKVGMSAGLLFTDAAHTILDAYDEV